jgi:uncharacterized protein (TIGR04222 family)
VVVVTLVKEECVGLGPFDMTGGPFLELYVTLFALAFTASLLIPPWLRPGGRDATVRDAGALAFLAGGAQRLTDAITARLLATGALTLQGKTFLPARRDLARTEPERQALALSPPAGWTDLQRTLKPAAEPIERWLLGAGLIMDQATTWQLRFWQTSPLLMLIGFGLTKWEVGRIRERPVGYLTGLLAVTAIVALVRFAIVNRRTRAGDRALTAARLDAVRLRLAPTAGEVDLGVALFGTAVLAGSPWAAFHQLRTSSDGGSGGDGGSGCGGGGCGGCGG